MLETKAVNLMWDENCGVIEAFALRGNLELCLKEWALESDCLGFELARPLPSWLTLGKSLAFLGLSILICEMV